MKWLQLSDIHLYFSNYQTSVLRDAMLKYLRENFNTCTDYLFITGDLSHQGESFSMEISNYLEEIIGILNIDKKSVFIIPGNHDVQRTPITERLIRSIIQAPNPLDEINKLESETRESCEATLDNYYNFYEEFFETNITEKKNHFIEERDKYNIIHINTAIYSGADNVEGNLLINLLDLLNVLRTLNKSRINIALGHHPIECFHPDIRETFINRLSDYNISMYLSGHVHNSEYFKEGNNYNDIYFFTSGSIIEEKFGDITFLAGSIDEESGESVVSFYTWNVEHEYWAKKNDLGRMAPDGDYRFKINRENEEDTNDDPEESINTNEFQKFLIDFYDVVSKNEEYSNLEFKDVSKKFTDMRCEFTQNKYDRHSQAFSMVNHVVSSDVYGGLERRMLIPLEVINVYEEVYGNTKSGDVIYNEMVNNLYNKYEDKFIFENDRLKLYISILVSWSIYECDIFNQVQSE